MTHTARAARLAAHALVEARDTGCHRCGLPYGSIHWWSHHHRRSRGMGGSNECDTAANIIVLCGSGTTGCHGWVTSHPTESAEAGWVVRHGTRGPSTTPMRSAVLGGWVLLNNAGGWRRVDQGDAA